MRKILYALLIFSVFLIIFSNVGEVSAQTYRFTLSQYEVEATINTDGTLSLYYYMVFLNDNNADPLDFIDVGLPTQNYDLQSITATVDGKSITGIGKSAYVDGIELPLRGDAIQPGKTGEVIVNIKTIRDILYPYDQPDRENYVNFQLSPNYFDGQFDKTKQTKYRVTIILPQGVGEEEGVYEEPQGWPDESALETSFTVEGNVYYSWYSEVADTHSRYLFKAFFPSNYVDASSIVTKPPSSGLDQDGDTDSGIFAYLTGLIGLLNFPCCCFGLIFTAFAGFIVYQATVGANKRKMQYLPPKISIEGHGIKRGLTAVEAAVLMEEPMDKILTMIMFSTVKKNAASIIERSPLKLEFAEPLPENLHAYELGFLTAFKESNTDERRKQLQSVMIDLVKTISTKMKGFSHKETVDYYKEIIKKAWGMVEEAQTPEIKSEKYDRTLEWTMLDKEYEERTQRTFTGIPVFLPSWWSRYDPVYRETIKGAPKPAASPISLPTSTTTGGKPSFSLPSIPGSAFAASILKGSSGMAAGVVGNLKDFTSGISSRTNPAPVITTSSSSGSGGFRGGGGGHSCACACACAGCACACAGGGR